MTKLLPRIATGCLFLAGLSYGADPDFNQQVRPILSANCFPCHGPDEHERKAGLRLDSYEGAIDSRKDGPAVDPQNLAKSEFIARISTSDPDEIMPPPKSHKKLTPEEVKILTEWVKLGAKYEKHWAFVKPTKQAPPASEGKTWSTREIDRYVHQRLREAGLKPMPPATKEELIRRLSLDLTGLPPTPAEREAFLKDNSPQAYERLVDRLLASDHYGERMTLAWMDASRYGDSSVMHADGPRFMWPWRDWVIRAYNSNMPFDQFTIEQLGGDLLPEATDQQKLATGFNRNHATSDEGGAFPEELRVDYIVDRVKTTANVWMGLSMECAQCHDHKYDPFTQREYYQFFAFFNNNQDPGMQSRNGNQAPVVKVASPERETQLAELQKERDALAARKDARREAAAGDIAAWIKEQQAEILLDGKPPMPEGLITHLGFDEAKDNPYFDLACGEAGEVKGKRQQGDRSGSASIKLDGKTVVDFNTKVGTTLEYNEPFSLAAWVKVPNNSGGAVFSKMDVGKAYRGYDLWLQGSQIGTHIINAWPNNAVKVVSKPKLRNNQWEHVAVTYDGSGKAAGVKIYINGKPVEQLVEQDDLTATIKSEVPFRIGARYSASNIKGEVDDVRMYSRVLSEAQVQLIQGSAGALAELFATSADKRTEEQKKALANLYLNEHDQAFKELAKEDGALSKKQQAINKAFPEQDSMIMADNAQMRATYILDRGMYDSPKKEEEIQANVPAFLPPLTDDAPRNRLGLAQWLVSGEHPLTARVTVNRYWMMLFGRGLVPSVTDFGNQGDAPSHPELLDWLAVDFVESGWDVKRMLKQIVMSETYRQSSRATEIALAKDRENRLLSRGARFRLQGEFIRDQALAASGLLVNQIGGASVKPYQPNGIWNEVSLNGGLRYKQDTGEKLYRRSMYTYWKRSAPNPAMVIFDAPSREKCVVQRARTNTPLQALVTLNEVTFVEASRNLAQRILKEGGENFADRINYAYLLLASREANEFEIEVCRKVFDHQLASFKASAESATSYITLGESKADETIDPAELAAWTVIANMILNLDEILTRG